MSWRCPDHSTDEKPWGCTCLTDRVAGLERDLAAARAEIERLKSGGCARDQRLTQHCALEVQARKELEEARECLMQAIDHVYPYEAPAEWFARWRKAAGMDTANAEAQRSEPAAGAG